MADNAFLADIRGDQVARKKRAAALVAGVLFACASNAGPFGLEMGASLADLKSRMALEESDGHPYSFSADKVPNSNSDFTTYKLLVTPEQGLCEIVATTAPIQSNASGQALTEKFEALQAALEKKYGAAKGKFDYVRSGSIWNEPHNWMMGLLKEERTLATYWSSAEGPLADNLKAMKLQAKAISLDAGSISVSYEFTNTSECIKRLNGLRD